MAREKQSEDVFAILVNLTSWHFGRYSSGL